MTMKRSGENKQPGRNGAGARGFTLIELMVGAAIAVFLTAAAMAFSSHELKLMGHSNQEIEMQQGARAALDLLVQDLRRAGQGLGYTANGTIHNNPVNSAFAGLVTGSFGLSHNGNTPQFNTNGQPMIPAGVLPVPAGAGHAINLRTTDNRGLPVAATLASVTMDLGIMFADGDYASIADYRAAGVNAGSGQFCRENPVPADLAFEAGDEVVMRTQDGLTARAVRLTNVAAAGACSFNRCLNGCVNYTFTALPQLFQTDSSAANVLYAGGEIHGGLTTVVWFVTTNNLPPMDNIGILRRAVLDQNNTCDGRGPPPGNNCGAIVADFVEGLFVQVWRWVPGGAGGPGTWTNAGQGPVQSTDRLRVDVELVVRSRSASNKPQQRVPVRLMGGGPACLPNIAAPCANPPGSVDWIRRRAYRTSVEIKNSGLMAFSR